MRHDREVQTPSLAEYGAPQSRASVAAHTCRQGAQRFGEASAKAHKALPPDKRQRTAILQAQAKVIVSDANGIATAAVSPSGGVFVCRTISGNSSGGANSIGRLAAREREKSRKLRFSLLNKNFEGIFVLGNCAINF